jgi:SH3 domain protein
MLSRPYRDTTDVVKLIALILIGLLPGLAAAESARYVTDDLTVTLRKGPGDRHPVLALLPSGDTVQVLQSKATNGFLRVRTRQGGEGWVLSRYLTTEPSSRVQLRELESKLAAMDQENRQLKQSIAALNEERTQAPAERPDLRAENQRLAFELDSLQRTAAGALETAANNQALKVRVTALERQLLTAQEENAVLRDRAARDWFMVGAVVVLLGLFVGLAIGRIWRPRKPQRQGW